MKDSPESLARLSTGLGVTLGTVLGVTSLGFVAPPLGLSFAVIGFIGASVFGLSVGLWLKDRENNERARRALVRQSRGDATLTVDETHVRLELAAGDAHTPDDPRHADQHAAIRALAVRLRATVADGALEVAWDHLPQDRFDIDRALREARGCAAWLAGFADPDTAWHTALVCTAPQDSDALVEHCAALADADPALRVRLARRFTQAGPGRQLRVAIALKDDERIDAWLDHTARFDAGLVSDAADALWSADGTAERAERWSTHRRVALRRAACALAGAELTEERLLGLLDDASEDVACAAAAALFAREPGEAQLMAARMILRRAPDDRAGWMAPERVPVMVSAMRAVGRLGAATDRAGVGPWQRIGPFGEVAAEALAALDARHVRPEAGAVSLGVSPRLEGAVSTAEAARAAEGRRQGARNRE